MYRENGVRAEVYNEGLTVYLFDESHAAAVADGLLASESEGAESQTLLDLAAAGTLVMYELFQDDPVDIEIDVGEPLAAAEKKPAKWMKLVRVPIDLPSGKLRVETGSSMDDADENPGAVVTVPPGKYELALHRVNWSKMEGKYEAYDGPDAVITLRPWPEKKKFKPKSSVIYCGDSPRAPWIGRYEVTDGTFRGEVINTLSDDSQRRLNINLDVPAFRQLDLKRGQRLELTAAGRTYTVLSQGEAIPAFATQFLGDEAFEGLADFHPMLLIGFQSSSGIPIEPIPTPVGMYRQYDYFVISTITNNTEAYLNADEEFNRIFALEPGSPVELRLVSDPFFVVDESVKNDWKVEGNEVHGRVVSCTDARIYLNIGLKALNKVGFKDGHELELLVGDLRRKVFDKTYITGRDWDDVLAKELKKPPAENLKRSAELKAQVYDANGTINSELEGWQDLLAEAKRLSYHPDDLANPPLTLEFVESRDFRGWEMLVLKSAFWWNYTEPHEIHIDAEAGTPVVVRRPHAGRAS